MATQSGSYTDLHDFINKLQVFAIANGWTTNKFVLGVGTSSNTEWYGQNGTQFVNVEGSITNGTFDRYGSSVTIDRPRLEAWGSTGFNGGSAINAQPGTSGALNTRVDWIVGPGLAYWFFSDGSTYVHAVAETVSNEFQHFVFGELDKAGTYTGGNYIDGTYWQQGTNFVADPNEVDHSAAFDSINANTNRVGMVYAPVVTEESYNGFHPLSTSGAVGSTEGRVVGSVRGGQPNWTLSVQATPNNFNDATPLQSIPLFIGRPSGLISPLGQVKDIRNLSIEFLTPKDTITLGGDTWQVFPITTKRDPADTGTVTSHNSGYHGYAYKIIP